MWSLLMIALSVAAILINLDNARTETKLGLSPTTSYVVAGIAGLAAIINTALLF